MVAPTASVTGSPPAAQGATRLRVAVAPSGPPRPRVARAPSGALLVDTAGADADEPGDGLTPGSRARVAAAFSRGPGPGPRGSGSAPPLAPRPAGQRRAAQAGRGVRRRRLDRRALDRDGPRLLRGDARPPGWSRRVAARAPPVGAPRPPSVPAPC